MIPVRDLSLSLGLFNTVGALILFHLSFQTGFCTLFLRNFIKQLPFELIEAARIEGAGEWTVFVRIVLPLIRPALAALTILVFTFVWNDYFWALCLTQGDDAAPITVGVAALKGQWTTAWNLVSAGSILAALPSVAMFFAMQKHFVAGLTFGATKG
jgi:multiple sugar transport system permease protein